MRASKSDLSMRGAGVCVLVMLSLSLAAQSDAVVYHDLSSMRPWLVGTSRIRGAMGRSGSLLISEMPPAELGAPGNGRRGHHHTQEQIMLGLGGSTVFLVSGLPYRLGSLGAVVTPANSEHIHINGSLSESATFIEFQPALRVDWFPPHPVYVAPQSAVPVPVSHGAQIFENLTLSTGGWLAHESGARTKVLSGQTIRLSMWDLSNLKASIALNEGHRPEQFVYLLDGEVELTVDGRRQELKGQMLAVVSRSAKDVRLRSLGAGRGLVAVFEAISR